MNIIKGILFVVATPIGNLGDISLRAIEVLKSVDFIICEDTRTSLKLMRSYTIEKPLYSYYSPREPVQALKYLKRIEAGDNVALITESGTPCISDPGLEIIKKAYDKGIEVIPVPGASALTAALSASGIICREVFFAGFIPRKKTQRKKYLEKHIGQEYAFVFYESKYRIIDTLRYIKTIAPGILICLAREMTKKYEEFIRGSIDEVEQKLLKLKNIKGEFVVVCSGMKK